MDNRMGVVGEGQRQMREEDRGQSKIERSVKLLVRRGRVQRQVGTLVVEVGLVGMGAK